ncbi:DnaJ domain-containing protein [Mycena amicta]|nr:DnaJ domain-containing protein [Mycena amicta]
MESDHDPLSQFFPGEESVDLYAVLDLTSDATVDAIKKAYRQLALKCHPDKQAAAASDESKSDAATRFQQVGFAYAVLSDEKRRQRYDKTGRTDEGFSVAEDGWDAYFEELFDLVTRDKLDEMKKEYQGDLATMPAWENGIKDEKAKLVRRKQGQKEATEAEEMAKELGVWDEFYGSGKTSERKGRGKKAEDAEEDHSALQALILKKKAKSDDFFDSLAAKYAEPASKSRKGKKRANADSAIEEPPSKKQRGVPPPPEIDDAEFEKLQQKLFGERSQTTDTSAPNKGRKGRKVK